MTEKEKLAKDLRVLHMMQGHVCNSFNDLKFAMDAYYKQVNLVVDKFIDLVGEGE